MDKGGTVFNVADIIQCVVSFQTTVDKTMPTNSFLTQIKLYLLC